MARKHKSGTTPLLLLLVGGLAGYTLAYHNELPPTVASLIESAASSEPDTIVTGSAPPRGGPAAYTAPVPHVQSLPQAVRPPTRRFVIAGMLNVRAAPEDTGKLVGQILAGRSVRVVRQAAGWSLVMLSSGRRGWVSSAYLSDVDPALRLPVPRPSRWR